MTTTHRRPLDELLAVARAELYTNTTITVYEMAGGREVPTLAWCDVCRGPRRCDVLTHKHPKVPEFRICAHCGHGVAEADEWVAAA